MARLLAAVKAAETAISQVAALPGTTPGDRLQLMHTLRGQLENHISRLSGQVATDVAKQGRRREDEE